MKKLLLPLVLGSALLASDIDIEISNNTIAGNANINIPQNQNFQLRGNYLYNANDGKSNYYSVGFGAIGDTPIDNYSSKISIFMDVDHTKDNTAIPLGISIFNDNFGGYKYPLFAKAEIAYAPDILSFDKANRELKTKVEIGVKPIENAKVFVGYKSINFNETYLSTGYAGIGFSF